jgi:hypothetical protein
MSFLYRVAIVVTRKQPYVDWANSVDDDGPKLTLELAVDRRATYLAPESDEQPDRDALLDEFWQQMFEEELSAWATPDENWPQPLTRELFDAWFDVELSDSVYDLTPEEPLSQDDVDVEDVADAIQRCAWCGVEVDEDADRFVSFSLPDRGPLAYRAGLTVPLAVDADRVVIGILSPADSEEAQAGNDLLFRACTRRCEKAILKAVPKALRKVLA